MDPESYTHLKWHKKRGERDRGWGKPPPRPTQRLSEFEGAESGPSCRKGADLDREGMQRRVTDRRGPDRIWMIERTGPETPHSASLLSLLSRTKREHKGEQGDWALPLNQPVLGRAFPAKPGTGLWTRRVGFPRAMDSHHGTMSMEPGGILRA